MAYSRAPRTRRSTRATGRKYAGSRTRTTRATTRKTARRSGRRTGSGGGTKTVRIVVHTVAQQPTADITRPYAVSEAPAEKRKATF